jgi:hypothetical protein
MSEPKTLEQRREEFRAEFLRELQELRRSQEAKAAAARAQQPQREVIEREVQVAAGDPNWTPLNGGRVRVLCDQEYSKAVDRTMPWGGFARVVKPKWDYHPFDGLPKGGQGDE